MVKRFVTLMAIGFFLLAFSGFAIAAPTVTVDGNTINFDVQPVIENGRTLVPLRAIFESLGAQVQWNEITKVITATKGDITISLVLGNNIAVKNNQNIPLDVAAKAINGRTMVPLRFVSECLGAKVDWVSENQTIIITSKEATTGTFPWDKGVYSGEINNTTPNGHGYYFSKDGTYYDGNFINGKKNGQGKLTFSTKEKYEGSFSNDQPNGQGIMTFADGSMFEGLFINGLPEEGTYTDHKGNTYEATWKDNQWVVKGSPSTQTSKDTGLEKSKQNAIDELTNAYIAGVEQINDAFQLAVDNLNHNKEIELDNLRAQMRGRGTTTSGIANTLLRQLNAKYDLKLRELENTRDNALKNLKANYENAISKYQ